MLDRRCADVLNCLQIIGLGGTKMAYCSVKWLPRKAHVIRSSGASQSCIQAELHCLHVGIFARETYMYPEIYPSRHDSTRQRQLTWIFASQNRIRPCSNSYGISQVYVFEPDGPSISGPRTSVFLWYYTTLILKRDTIIASTTMPTSRVSSSCPVPSSTPS